MLVTDAGTNYSTWTSNGAKWFHDAPIIQASDNQAYVLPGYAASSTAAQTGTTVTVTYTSGVHNIPTGTYNGGFVYFPGSSGGTGTAIAAGWYGNFQYLTTTTFSFTYSSSQTAVGQSVNGGAAYTTATAVNFATSAQSVSGGINIPAGLMGNYGSLFVDYITSWFSATTGPTIAVTFGGTSIFSSTPSSGTRTGSSNVKFVNFGPANNRIYASGAASYYSAASSTVLTINSTVNTAAAQTAAITLKTAAANDYVALMSATFSVINAN